MIETAQAKIVVGKMIGLEELRLVSPPGSEHEVIEVARWLTRNDSFHLWGLQLAFLRAMGERNGAILWTSAMQAYFKGVAP